VVLQGEERRRFQVSSVAWLPDFAHPRDDQVENGDRFRVPDLENPYRVLVTGSTRPERPCTPLGYKEAGPYTAMASHTPSHSHHTVHRYRPVKTRVVSVDCFVECDFVHTSNRSAVIWEEIHMSIDKESLKNAETNPVRIRNAVSWLAGTGLRAAVWKGHSAQKFPQS